MLAGPGAKEAESGASQPGCRRRRQPGKPEYVNLFPHTTHTVALRNLMAPDDGWREGIHEKELTWDELDSPTTVPIQIDNVAGCEYNSVGYSTRQ